MLTQKQKKLLLLSSLGGVLEFYDFIIYALLASYIAHEFFPLQSNITSLIATFTTFSVGYLVRPLGGIIFGHFGDKYGRKKTFTFSIFLMAIATFCIGLVPTYSHIGLAAPIILTCLRILQGLSIGGEIPGAIAYVCESIPEKKGLACGVIFFALNNGIVLGSLIQAALSSSLTDTQMYAWGWRIPFFLGGIFGFFSYFLRGQLEESSMFKAIEHKTESFPLITVLHKHLKSTLAAICIIGFGATCITLLFLFTPSYLNKVLHQNTHEFMWINTVAIFIVSVLSIIIGIIADKMNHKLLLTMISLLAMISAYPIFNIYVNHFEYFYIPLLLSTVLSSAWGGISILLSDLFPTKIRYSGIALSYNFGFGLFGGLTPLIAMTLIYETGMVIAPMFYLLFAAGLALVSLAFVRK